jgi:hypothetical protein
MLPLMVTYIQNNLSSEGMTWGFPNRESPDCGQWQHSPTMLLLLVLQLAVQHVFCTSSKRHRVDLVQNYAPARTVFHPATRYLEI